MAMAQLQPMHKPTVMGAAAIALALIIAYHFTIGRRA